MTTIKRPSFMASELAEGFWRKSSYSGSSQGQCVECAETTGACVAVRDSKEPEGPALLFSAAAFGAFIGAVRGGTFA